MEYVILLWIDIIVISLWYYGDLAARTSQTPRKSLYYVLCLHVDGSTLMTLYLLFHYGFLHMSIRYSMW